jgi:hypothetical protein
MQARQNPETAESQDVFILLQACVLGKAAEDFVFTRPDGNPVLDFHERWKNLTTVAGCAGLLFHDLRRSAVRNMVHRGVTETVAMKISGHKTRAVFDRYNVTSESDLADAARKIEAGKQVWAENGQNFDKMHKSGASVPAQIVPATVAN